MIVTRLGIDFLRGRPDKHLFAYIYINDNTREPAAYISEGSLYYVYTSLIEGGKLIDDGCQK